MSRILSENATASALAQTTTRAWLWLLEIDVDGTQYYTNNHENVTVDGQEYTAWPFEVAFLSDKEGRPAELTLRIDNVDQTLITLIRQQNNPIDVRVGMAISGEASSEIDPATYAFKLREVTYNAEVIEAKLAFEPLYDESFPAHTMSPSLYPGIFGAVTVPDSRGDLGEGGGGPAHEANEVQPTEDA